MSDIIDSCPHTDEIIDAREGNYICLSCGLCKDAYFEQPEINTEYSELGSNGSNDIGYENICYIKEILSRLNVPLYISDFISKAINENKGNRKITKPMISHYTYITLSEMGIPFSIKDICGVTGTPQKIISKEQSKMVESSVIIIETDDLLWRYCSKLGIRHQFYTVIKEMIPKVLEGYNPSTIVSAYIYIFCRRNKIKLTIKQISTVTGISCMSIQRFIKKNELSFRT